MPSERDTPQRPPAKPAPKPHEDEKHEKREAAKPEPEGKGKTVKVTYHPEQGDPINTEWHGIKFVGNVPKDVPVAKRDLIEAAKSNPWFSVEGSPRAPKILPTGEKITPPGRDIDPVALDDSKMVEDC